MILMNKKEAYECFLTSSWWKELSKRKRRLVGKCERCQATRHLQAHHKFYRDNWFDTKLDDLEVLCRPCHESEHHLNPKPIPTKVPVNKLEFMTREKVLRARSKKLISRKRFEQLRAELIAKGKWSGIKKSHRKKSRTGFLQDRKCNFHYFDSMPKSRGWWAGMYEGLTPQQVRSQIGTYQYESKFLGKRR